LWIEGCPYIQCTSPQVDDINYLGLQLTWHKHTEKLGITLTKLYWLLECKSKLSTSHKCIIQSNTETNLDIENTILGYSFHIQHGNLITLPTESLAHDNERILVYAEYDYPKVSPNTYS
jgi:hypothetical protein